MESPRTSRVARLLSALGALVGASLGFGQTLAVHSPFMIGGSAGAAASAPAEAYELAGSSVQGADISVCIYERGAKRSQWISVGDTVDGVHVVSFNPQEDRAVVTISGATKELSLRKAAPASATQSLAYALRGPPSGSSQVASIMPLAPTGAAAPSTPESAAREQKEARMLVSDLLEIGVQQRKAYQDAKQKSAADASSQPAN